MMRIVQGELSDPRVVGLLQIHLTNARGATAPGSAHALDMSGLQSPDISFWTIWDDEMLVGMGALKRLSADHGEIKSVTRSNVAIRDFAIVEREPCLQLPRRDRQVVI